MALLSEVDKIARRGFLSYLLVIPQKMWPNGYSHTVLSTHYSFSFGPVRTQYPGEIYEIRNISVASRCSNNTTLSVWNYLLILENVHSSTWKHKTLLFVRAKETRPFVGKKKFSILAQAFTYSGQVLIVPKNMFSGTNQIKFYKKWRWIKISDIGPIIIGQSTC